MTQEENLNQKQKEPKQKTPKPKSVKATPEQVEEFETQILEIVNGKGYRPVKPKTLAKKLKIEEELHVSFRRTVKKLVKAQKLSWGPGHLVARSKSEAAAKESAQTAARRARVKELDAADRAAGAVEADLPPVKERAKTKSKSSKRDKPKKEKAPGVVGRFRRARQGFGFVTPDPVKHPELEGDIHIPFRYTLDAADRDIVSVRIVKQDAERAKKGLLGRVLEVVERSKYKFVGTYREEGGSGYVAVDANAFDQPILVGDAGAKRCGIDDKVVIEMVRFPTVHSSGEGVIVEVLGPRGKPGVDTLTVMREFELPEEFPEKVIEAARKQAEKFDEAIPKGRGDYTQETVITIDPETARDFDDAISLKRIENNHWMLGVHIADVSHFVQPNTAIDNEAYKRGTSVYLPDRVVPMIPETISNNLASLQPDRVRYTVTAWIEMTPDGARVKTEVNKGAIKSCRRFTYEEVDDFLEDREGWKSKVTPEVHQLLCDMHELAMIIRKRRDKAGSIELLIPNVRIDLDRDGKVTGAHNEIYTESHQIIEEFMLSANEAVAEMLSDLELPYLRRIHENPDPRKLRFMTEFIRELGIECESLESRFEIKRVLELVRERPEAQAVSFSMLRSMKKATYSPREFGHYALSSDNYCHFTSPIRRYPDLVIHRMVAALEEGVRPAVDFGTMLGIGDHCSQTEEVAEKAERQLRKLKLLNFFADKVGEQIECFITGVDARGFFAQGLEIPVEGFVPLKVLPRDNYDYYQGSHMIIGRASGESFRLGDPVTLVIAKVDLDNRELEFTLGVDTHGIKRKATQQAQGPGGDDRRGRGKKDKGGAKAKGKSRGKSRNKRDKSKSKSKRK